MGLHPGLDTNDPARPLIEGIADLDETDESNNETLAPNENVTDLVVTHLKEIAIQKTKSGHRAVTEQELNTRNAKDLDNAKALSDQSASLHDQGQREEALTAIQEAVSVFRSLAVGNPAAFNADLALSLRTLSVRLANVTRRGEALTVIEEAVGLHRALADQLPAEFNAELASSLNHLSNRLSRLDRHEEALLAIQESADLYRILAKDRPESHNPGLAASLYNLSNRLSKYDLWEEALVAVQEASGIYRGLAAEKPTFYKKNLVLSLTKVSVCLENLDRQAEARAASQAAARIAGTQDSPDIEVERVPRSSAVASRSPVFHTFGSGVVNNVAGNYTTADEGPVAKISRMLPYAEGASWDPDLTCLPGTRLTILSLIDTWASCTDSKGICWLKDVAGSGKSAILHTIAQKLYQEGRLGSSFFFSRGTASRNTARNLLTTIARDLANLHPDIAQDIAEALEAEPALASASLSRQFDTLILGPSRRLPIDRPIVLVIDALDEGISHDLDTEFLAILRDKATQLPPQVRLLITSRPTSAIEEYLSCAGHVMTHSIDIFSVENKRDIDMYVDSQLRNEATLRKMGVTSPDEVVIDELKKLTEGLFIWIVTVCNFLRTAYRPKDKLQALLSKTSRRGSPPEKKMDLLYAAILAECGDWEDADFVKDYDLVVGTIMAAKRPLSLAALRALHDGSQELDPEQLLHRFGSVLIGFRDPHQPIRILHLSFHEFVTDHAAHDDSTKHFHLSEQAHSGRLAKLCIITLNRELAKPIPGTGYLAIHPDDLPGIPKIFGASEQLVYGCAHWPDHIQDAERSQTIQNHLITLISKHIVTWIEVATSTGVFRGSLMVRTWLEASALHFLGHRLAHDTRLEEAVLAAEEEVNLSRILVTESPVAYSTGLALALSNLSFHLSALHRSREAFTIIQEAVKLWRVLSVEDPMAHNAHFAAALFILSAQHSSLGRPQEALEAVEEAVNLQQALAAERPASCNAGLAAALSNKCIRLSELGRVNEALSAGQEAVDQYRALRKEARWAYKPELASTLNNLSNDLLHFHRPQEALPVIREAVDLYRDLAVERPNAYNGSLAACLSTLSNCLSELGRADEAFVAVEEAVNLRRALAADRPAVYHADLASTLTNLANRLGELGRENEAFAAAEEAVNLYRILDAERPAGYNDDFSIALNCLSNRLSALGRTNECLSAIREAVDLRRALAAEQPMAHAEKLATTLQNLSRRLIDVGQLDEALCVLPEAVELRRSLAAERPAEFNRPLMESLAMLAKVLKDLGREEFLEVGQEMINMYETLEGHGAAGRLAAEHLRGA
ncbi:hypothetical protein HWV62_42715 [Athelia sp. TMB]|nr:hypothetical protein HWV62_42715 [Athelia sp. TMB]